MSLSETSGGLPPRRIPETGYQKFVNPCAYFASGVYNELLLNFKQIPPKDILVVGDDWLQLINIKEIPPEIASLFKEQTIPLGLSFGSPFRCDAWPLMPRSGFKDMKHILDELQKGVNAGSLDPQILRELLILDLTQECPILTETDLSQTKDTPWGTNGFFQGTGTFLWHIQENYHRQELYTDTHQPGFEALLYTQESVGGLDPNIWQ